uniref:Phlebovirus_G2 domain-containing protein n=1 Tax=Heterorhabditis bacteriophora TaxID=37862 RepID=A0A1I7W979_HETBA
MKKDKNFFNLKHCDKWGCPIIMNRTVVATLCTSRKIISCKELGTFSLYGSNGQQCSTCTILKISLIENETYFHIICLTYNKETIMFTRRIQYKALNGKRCLHAGPHIDNFSKYLETTRCTESCYSQRCDCFYPRCGYVVYIINLVPIVDNQYEINSAIIKLATINKYQNNSKTADITFKPKFGSRYQTYPLTYTHSKLTTYPTKNMRPDGPRITRRLYNMKDKTKNCLYSAKNKIHCDCKERNILQTFNSIKTDYLVTANSRTWLCFPSILVVFFRRDLLFHYFEIPDLQFYRTFFMQDLWKENRECNQTLTEDRKKTLSISHEGETEKHIRHELHISCASSKDVYADCTYLRDQEGTNPQLIYAKMRLINFNSTIRALRNSYTKADGDICDTTVALPMKKH